MATYGGWTGKTLRVNLSTGKISSEDTIGKYKDYLGGTGVGYKVLWDEVPAKTKCFDEANKIVLGVGPLTGTGAMSSARTSITTIFPPVYPVELVGTGHMGGHWGAELKYAGWDNVIIEGKSEKPVYIAIIDEKVEIRDAAELWGSGIFRATTSICQEMGPEAQVAAIGQAGENLARMATINCSKSHSAGGVGGVFGSKKLKAIAVIGTGSVKVAASAQDWKKLVRHVLSITGANNNHAVPSTPQPWAEFFHPNSRWTARKGLYWGAADPPVETGEYPAGDLNHMGLRTMKATLDLGPLAEKYTVRMGGCASCPIRCHWHVDMPQMEEKYGVSRYAASTCIRWRMGTLSDSYPDQLKVAAAGRPSSPLSLEAAILGLQLADDYGIWSSYSQLLRDFKWAYKNGMIKANLPAEEYKSIAWEKLDKGDPTFNIDFYRRIAFREGELGFALGEGPGYLAERWKFPEAYFQDPRVGYFKMGHTLHHSSEESGQVGGLVNLIYNRDAACHSHENLLRSGLPTNIIQEIAAKIWGAGAVDTPQNFKPMNPAKAKFAVWALLRKELHDSLTLCNWMYPLVASPLKSRKYEGDNSVEAQLYSAVTGDKKDVKELDQVGERIFNLHRALTVRDLGTTDMRNKHDVMPDYVFDEEPDKKPFTPGVTKMDRDDMEVAKGMFYEQLGWDKETGSPTRAALERLGMKDVADKLFKTGLLPG